MVSACCQGHIQGALPSGRYGQDGRLTLSRTLVLPIEQAPYTPSSFSGSNPSPPPPAPFSPGQTPPTGQAPSSRPTRVPPPLLQDPAPLPAGPTQAFGRLATGDAAPGIGMLGSGRQSVPKADQAGGWATQGASNSSRTGPAPVFTVPGVLIGRQSSVSAAQQGQQPAIKPLLPAGAAPTKAPQSPSPLTTPGQISFDTSELPNPPGVPSRSPVLSRKAAASQFVMVQPPWAGSPMLSSQPPQQRQGAFIRNTASMAPTGAPSPFQSAQRSADNPTVAPLEAPPGTSPSLLMGKWSPGDSSVTFQPAIDTRARQFASGQKRPSGNLFEADNRLQHQVTTQDIEMPGRTTCNRVQLKLMPAHVITPAL